MIYIITCGEYSDYRILTATTDYEYALKFKQEYDSCEGKWSVADIETYEDNAPTKLITYECFFKDGEVTECTVVSSTKQTTSYNKMYNTGRCTVLASNKYEAVKIASERMAKYRMENK